MNFQTEQEQDRLAIRDMKQELWYLELWLSRAENSTTETYAQACDRAIDLRRVLGLPEQP